MLVWVSAGFSITTDHFLRKYMAGETQFNSMKVMIWQGGIVSWWTIKFIQCCLSAFCVKVFSFCCIRVEKSNLGWKTIFKLIACHSEDLLRYFEWGLSLKISPGLKPCGSESPGLLQDFKTQDFWPGCLVQNRYVSLWIQASSDGRRPGSGPTCLSQAQDERGWNR